MILFIVSEEKFVMRKLFNDFIEEFGFYFFSAYETVII